MKIISSTITRVDLKQMAAEGFGNLVKAVVDINRELIALDAELHADLEALLLAQGSKQKDLWGINFYPQASAGDFIEFDSVINLRPWQENKSRSVENEEIRKKIIDVVAKRMSE